MLCPACDAQLVWRQNGAWCDRCHRKVETCCEGAPQAICDGALTVSTGPFPSEERPGRASVIPVREPTNRGESLQAFGAPSELHPHLDCLPDGTLEVQRV